MYAIRRPDRVLSWFENNLRTAIQWFEDNPVLPAGLIGVESDTNKKKVGDGDTTWNLLEYMIDSDSAPLILDGDPG